MSSVVVLGSALALDWFVGEPPARLHPVVWMGRVATWGERALFKGGPVRQLAAGFAVAVVIPGAFAAGAAWLIGSLEDWPVVSAVTSIWLLKSTFAFAALGQAARRVEQALRRGDLASGREALASLCSRDGSALGAEGVAAAAVESVAENASDSVVAPLFYFALLGLPGAVFYRAVNTLDAMIGYRGRYEYYGKAAARLDDLLNLVPARLTAGVILFAGLLSGRDARRGFRIMVRDRRKTESPNAGWPMAAMAGLLGVELVKEGHYRLGDPLQVVAPRHIETAWRLVVGASLMVFAAVIAVTAGRARGV